MFLNNCLSHIYRDLLWCVGLLIVTSDGLAGRLQCLAISPVINAHRSVPLGRRDKGDLESASVNVCKLAASVPSDSGGATPGGGDMFLGRGDDLIIKKKFI